MVAPIPSVVATDLVIYVNKLLGLTLDFTHEIKKSEWLTIVTTVQTKVESLLTLEVETDVEGCFNMLFDLIHKLQSDKATTEAKKVLCVVLKKQDDKSVLRLRIASNLFNKLIGFPDVRLETLLKLIEYASATKNLDLVSGYFDMIETLFDHNQLSPEKCRLLYLTIANELAKTSSSRLKVILFLEKYLNTFTTSDAKTIASGKEVAVRAVKLVLEQPIESFTARIQLISNPVVAQLKTDKTTSKLYQLFEIISFQTLKEYIAFEKATGPAFFKEQNLNPLELTSTMRLFTLCTLPTGFEEIRFETIAQALSIDVQEVESWVVKAITAHLICAKVDQLQQTVVITRSMQREFGIAQWKQVSTTLQLYKKNVGALLEVVRNARMAHTKN